jgi:hypothetical protein
MLARRSRATDKKKVLFQYSIVCLIRPHRIKSESRESSYYRVMDVYVCVCVCARCILKSFNWNEKQDERNNNMCIVIVCIRDLGWRHSMLSSSCY